MKNNKKKTANGPLSPTTYQVRLEFKHPTAMAVSIRGTFNDWREGITPMVSLGEGRWFKVLVLPPGAYEYMFVADGEWMRDPQAQESVPNPFGGLNSVLRVPPAPLPNGRTSPVAARNGPDTRASSA